MDGIGERRLRVALTWEHIRGNLDEISPIERDIWMELAYRWEDGILRPDSPIPAEIADRLDVHGFRVADVMVAFLRSGIPGRLP